MTVAAGLGWFASTTAGLCQLARLGRAARLGPAGTRRRPAVDTLGA